MVTQIGTKEKTIFLMRDFRKKKETMTIVNKEGLSFQALKKYGNKNNNNYQMFPEQLLKKD